MCWPLFVAAQVTSEWRKISTKLEGEPEYEALDKLERLEGFQVCTRSDQSCQDLIRSDLI